MKSIDTSSLQKYSYCVFASILSIVPIWFLYFEVGRDRVPDVFSITMTIYYLSFYFLSRYCLHFKESVRRNLTFCKVTTAIINKYAVLVLTLYFLSNTISYTFRSIFIFRQLDVFITHPLIVTFIFVFLLCLSIIFVISSTQRKYCDVMIILLFSIGHFSSLCFLNKLSLVA